MNHALTRLLAATSVTLLLGGCAEEPPTDPGLLGLVPADTPYAFVATRPWPPVLVDKVTRNSQAQYQNTLDDVRGFRRQMQEEGADGEVPPEALEALAVFEALLVELAEASDSGDFGALGFKTDATLAIYALAALPVMRVEIDDAAKVEQLLSRVERNSGHAAEQRELDGIAYRRIAAGPVVGIVSVQPQELVVGLLPVAQEERWLPVLLGIERPEHTLAGTGVMAEINQDYGFSGYGEGFIDLRALVRIFSGADSSSHGKAWQALEGPGASAGCQRLLDDLAAEAPRVVMGLHDIHDDGYAMTVIHETSTAVAAGLKALPRAEPLPGMGSDSEAMGAFGMGLDSEALRQGVTAMLRFIAAKGKSCEWVDPQDIEQAAASTNLMLGPMLQGFNGVYAELHDMAVNYDTLEPDKVTAGMVLAVDDPQGAIGMAAAMVNPALMDLNLPLDGSSVEVPRELLPPEVPPLYLAARPGLLAMATGEGAAARASALLSAPVSDQPLLISADADMVGLLGRMSELLGAMADRMEADGMEEAAREMRAQVAEMKAHAAAGGDVRLSVVPDDRGLLMRQWVRLP